MSKIALVKPAYPLRANLTRYLNITVLSAYTHRHVGTVVSPSEVFLRKDRRLTISSRSTDTGLVGLLDWRHARFIGMLPDGTVEDVTFE